MLAVQEVGLEHVLDDLNAAWSIDFDNQLASIPDAHGIRVALLSPRLLSDRVDITTFPLGVVPVQSRDLIFDNPATPENEALSGVLGRSVLSATVRAGDERVRRSMGVDGDGDGRVDIHNAADSVHSAANYLTKSGEGERLRYTGYALYRRTAEAMACRAAIDTVLAAAGGQVGDHHSHLTLCFRERSGFPCPVPVPSPGTGSAVHDVASSKQRAATAMRWRASLALLQFHASRLRPDCGGPGRPHL